MIAKIGMPFHSDQKRNMSHVSLSSKNFPNDPSLPALLGLRTAQINQCQVGISHHTASLMDLGESIQRISEVKVWRGSCSFNDRERFAFAFSEIVVITPESLSTEILNTAQLYFTKEELVALSFLILATIELD